MVPGNVFMPLGHARLLSGSGRKTMDLAAGPWRALYAWKGAVRVSGENGRPGFEVPCGTGAALDRAAVKISTDSTASVCLVWEVTPQKAPPGASPEGFRELLRYDMPRLPGDHPDTLGEAVLRFERVDLKPGVETPRHTHIGSGLRVLIKGTLVADIDGRIQTLNAGDAWLEKGPGEAVTGRAAAGLETAFVRLLVLPADAAGQDSFVFLEGGAADRPRPAAYERYHEERVLL